MEGGGSVRRNIALKLKEPPSLAVKAPPLTSVVSTESSNLSEKKRTSHSSVSTSSGGAVHKAWETLQWDQPLNLIGRPITNPLLHICEQCDHPILIYGRMKHCRHTFCRECAKKANGECPKCHETDQVFEEASMGNVFVCTNGGGRYDNKGCGRSYLSQRDLDAHIAYRHDKDKSTSSAAAPPILPSTAPAPIPSLAALQNFFPPGTAPQPPLKFPPALPTGTLPIPLPPGFPTQQPPRFVAPTSWTRPPTSFQ